MLTLNLLIDNEQGRYVSIDVPSCNVSNNPNYEDLGLEDPDERGTVNYYLVPSHQFENVENFGNAVSGDYTPWVNSNIAHSSGEFVVGQGITSKAVLKDAVKLYSIKSHQPYVVVASSKNFLVLRCKKAEE